MTYKDKASYGSSPPCKNRGGTFSQPTHRIHDTWYMIHETWPIKHETRVTWLISLCDMTHFYVWRDSFLRETRGMWYTRHEWRDSFVCATWLTSMCNVTHFYVKHEACDTRDMRDVTHFYVWRDSPLCLSLSLSISLSLSVSLSLPLSLPPSLFLSHSFSLSLSPSLSLSSHARVRSSVYVRVRMGYIWHHTATHCNTLQHTATHCNTPQRENVALTLTGILSGWSSL